MSTLEIREGIKITGHRGTWYVIDETIRDGQTLYLVEHETYGDEAACLIINSAKEVVLDDVWNGFDDYDEAVECGYIGE